MAKAPTADPAAKPAKADPTPAAQLPRDANQDHAEPAGKALPAPCEFTATRAILHDGEVYDTGAPIALTKTQHARLFAVGAVAEAWPD